MGTQLRSWPDHAPKYLFKASRSKKSSIFFNKEIIFFTGFGIFYFFCFCFILKFLVFLKIGSWCCGVVIDDYGGGGGGGHGGYY